MIKAMIRCPHCNQEHQIKYSQNNDRYKCPNHSKVFFIDENLITSIINATTTTESKNIAKPEYLLPLTEKKQQSQIFSNLPKNNKANNNITEKIVINHEQTLHENAEEYTLHDSSVELVQDSSSLEILCQPQIKQNFDGKQINKYLLQEHIGEGGGGKVYKAHDHLLKRSVAIKVLHPLSSEKQVNEFKKEAEVQAQLNHSNIAQIYDFGITEDNMPYIAMEYIQGKTITAYLASFSDNKQLFLQKSMEVFVAVSEALLYLEEKGICHQDIKPSNIVFSEEAQTIKILDFGLAVVSENTTENKGYSLRFTAPERYDLKIKPSTISDIFSFGCVMYQVLTGRYAIQGTSMRGIISNTCNLQVTFLKSDNIDDNLKKICLKCLEIDIKNRYSTVKKLNIDLTECLSKISNKNEYPYLYSDNVVFYLKKDKNYIGRNFSNDIILQNKDISRIHACVIIEGDQFFLENLSQGPVYITQGTDVKEVTPSKKIQLKHGCKIELSTKTLYFIEEVSDDELASRNTMSLKPNESFYEEKDVLRLLNINSNLLKNYIKKHEINIVEIKNRNLYPIMEIKRLKATIANENITIISEKIKRDSYAEDTVYFPYSKISEKKNAHIYECKNIAGDTTFIQLQKEIPILFGKEIDNYKIIQKIGQGSTGDIFKVVHKETNKIAALKILTKDVSSNDNIVKRFKREITQVLQLSHPNLISAHTAGDYKGQLYYVMDFVEGIDLQKRITAYGIYTEYEAVKIITQVARVLFYAYGYSLIHRDIKPDNIIVDSNHITKLCDLGLAKSLGSSSQITVKNSILGTPNFMSPEQARGDDLDCQSDIFSLGSTLYYMLTKMYPFDGTGLTNVMLNIVEEDPISVYDINPLISNETCNLIVKMMHKEKKDRYQNYEELLKDLNEINKSLTDRMKVQRITTKFERCFAPSLDDIAACKVAIRNNIATTEQIEKCFDYQESLKLSGIEANLLYVMYEQKIITSKQQTFILKMANIFNQDNYEQKFIKICEKLCLLDIAEIEKAGGNKSKLITLINTELNDAMKQKVRTQIARELNSEYDQSVYSLAIQSKIISGHLAKECLEAYRKEIKSDNYVTIGDIFVREQYLHENDLEALLRAILRSEITEKLVHLYLGEIKLSSK